MKDDIVFGSLFGIVANIIAFLCCFFGGRNEILWLCIVGFVVFGIGMLLTFVHKVNGWTNLLASTGMVVVMHFWGEKLGKFYTWFVASGTSGIFYVNGLLLAAMCASTILLVISISSARG